MPPFSWPKSVFQVKLNFGLSEALLSNEKPTLLSRSVEEFAQVVEFLVVLLHAVLRPSPCLRALESLEAPHLVWRLRPRESLELPS